MEHIQIDIYPDGNQICAIIGEMPTEIAVGFGDTAKEAIELLLIELESYHKFCPICLQEAEDINEIYEEIHYCCPNGHAWWDIK